MTHESTYSNAFDEFRCRPVRNPIRKINEELEAIGPITELFIAHKNVVDQINVTCGMVDSRTDFEREVQGVGFRFVGIPIVSFDSHGSMMAEIAKARAAGRRHVKVYDDRGHDVTDLFWTFKINHQLVIESRRVKP